MITKSLATILALRLILTTATTAAPICPLPKYTITDFSWFNSSHNVDCPADKSTFCLSPGNCGVPVCATGLPVTPPGYGPADTLTLRLTEPQPSSSDYYTRTCSASNPGSVPSRPIGTGDYVKCGGAAYPIKFLGQSMVSGNGTKPFGQVSLERTVSCQAGSMSVAVQGRFALNCSSDAGGNATCTAVQASIDLAVVGYAKLN